MIFTGFNSILCCKGSQQMVAPLKRYASQTNVLWGSVVVLVKLCKMLSSYIAKIVYYETSLIICF